MIIFASRFHSVLYKRAKLFHWLIININLSKISEEHVTKMNIPFNFEANNSASYTLKGG